MLSLWLTARPGIGWSGYEALGGESVAAIPAVRAPRLARHRPVRHRGRAPRRLVPARLARRLRDTAGRRDRDGRVLAVRRRLRRLRGALRDRTAPIRVAVAGL